MQRTFSNWMFCCHHWPLWGRQNIQSFLAVQRDTYKFIHDQTVRLMSRGATPREIADLLRLPSELSMAVRLKAEDAEGESTTVKITFEGSRLDLIGFFSMLDKPQGRFNIVTP